MLRKKDILLQDTFYSPVMYIFKDNWMPSSVRKTYKQDWNNEQLNMFKLKHIFTD